MGKRSELQWETGWKGGDSVRKDILCRGNCVYKGSEAGVGGERKKEGWNGTRGVRESV